MSERPDIHEMALRLLPVFATLTPVPRAAPDAVGRAYEFAEAFIAERARRMEAEKPVAPALVPEPDYDGWIPHDGGPCPEKAKGRRVQYKLLDGSVGRLSAHFLVWEWAYDTAGVPAGGCITHYRFAGAAS